MILSSKQFTPFVSVALTKSLAFALAFSFVCSPLGTFAQTVTQAPLPTLADRASTNTTSDIATNTSVVGSTSEISSQVEKKEAIPTQIESADSVSPSPVAKEAPVKEEQKKDAQEVPQVNSIITQAQQTQSQSQPTLKPEMNKATGALTYRYPLEIPRGRGNMTPEIVLTYNSQNMKNDSILGYGWELSIPYIQRRNLHGTDQLYTGAYTDFTSSIHGDLVQIPNTQTYRPESTTEEYALYTLTNNAFVIKDKQGITYTYGATTASRQDDLADPTHIFKWMLSKVEDTNGNFISYTYFKDQGQIYPDSITYTNTSTASGIYMVEFTRELRVDNMTLYNSAFPVTTNYRVSSVVVKTNGVTSRTYTFNYMTGDNGVRSMLASIGQVVGGVNLPPMQFAYTKNTTSNWQNYNIAFPIYTDLINGFSQAVDFNGDAYTDIMTSFYDPNYLLIKKSYKNNGNGTWTDVPTYYVPASQNMSTVFAYMDAFFINAGAGANTGISFLDTNGDFLSDLVQSLVDGWSGDVRNLFLNQNGWQSTSATPGTAAIPKYTYGHPYGNLGSTMDVNADGLSDFITYIPNASYSVSLNQGNSIWTVTPNYFLPTDPSDTKALFGDLNADGLVDIVRDGWYWTGNACQCTQYVVMNSAYTNTGNLQYATTTNFASPYSYSFFPAGQPSPGYDWGSRLIDINNDGLSDLVYGVMQTYGTSHNATYINTGNGWTQSTTQQLPPGIYFSNGNFTNGNFIDIDADGVQEIYMNGQVYKNISAVIPDLLTTITLSSGGTYTTTYKSSAQYKDSNNTLLNPSLPLIVQTVESITANDGNGNTETTTYTYADGSYYYAGPFDRTFAGFGIITETTPTKTIKTYYHQGNSTNTSLGEYQDSKPKIAKEYRKELYDPSGAMLSFTTTKWGSTQLASSNAYFVYPLNTLTRNIAGGISTDTATAYSWNVGNGTLANQINYGIVLGNNNGTFTNTGADTYTTSYTYLTNSTTKVVAPRKITLKNNSNTIEQETINYYDNSATGVNKGNLTKTETLTAGTNYIATQTTYSPLGLPLTETDPNGNVTTYSYDNYNLYPITITKPLGVVRSYIYDYALGKPQTEIDPNGKTHSYTYDGFGRMLSESVADPNTGASVLSRTFAYTDTPNALATQESVYLNPTNVVDSVTHFDGFKRPIQKTNESLAGYATTDTLYNPDGTIQKQSLPYATLSLAKVPATTDPTLYTVYAYDALGRILSETDATGSTTHNYAGLSDTITNKNGKQKTYTTDVYGNLVSVTEYLAGVPYTTTYTYNGLKNLLSITDALGNMRSFTYDLRGLRTSSEDLHAPADATFGVYTYLYDSAGNLVAKTNPNGSTTTYTYNALNQNLTEDDSSTPTLDISYTYNTCANGKEKLCSSTKDGITKSYNYDNLGNLATETLVDGANSFQTTYTRDRQGNIVRIIHPDNSGVEYTYSNAGLQSGVKWKTQTGTLYNTLADITATTPTGKPLSITRASGLTTTYTYDPTALYRLTNISSQKGTSPKVQDMSYTYDGVGNILSYTDNTVSTTKKTVTYTYDELSRLLSASNTNLYNNATPFTETFTYNPLGNILTKGNTSYSYLGTGFANPHAPTTIGGSTYTYDNQGNLLTAPSKTFAWNYKNELMSITTPTVTSTYYYTPDGQRIKELSGTTTIYTPTDSYTQTNTNGTLTKTKQVTLSDIYIASILNNTLSYPTTNHLGSLHKMTNTGGNVTEITDYHSFGNERLHSGTSSKRRYIGEEYDSATLLNYLNARYYESAKGSFISQDPVFWEVGSTKDGTAILLNPQAQNSYSYALNNPIVYSDKSGRCVGLLIIGCAALAEWITAAGGIAAIGALSASAPYLGSIAENRKETAVLLPGIGDYMAAKDAVTGSDSVSGRTLAPWERALAGFSAVPVIGSVGDAGRQIVKAGDKIAGLRVSEHAAEQAGLRGVSAQQIENTIQKGQGFQYFHENKWKTGYINEKIFVGVGNDTNKITTLFTNISSTYKTNLLAKTQEALKAFNNK